MSGSSLQLSDTYQIDTDAIFKALNLNPRDPNTQALMLVCQRYQLDPLLKHLVLIQNKPYITRDGYLAIAHRSGVFDGMEVLEQGEDKTHYIAKVAIYRKDMSHPFTLVGRYSKASRMARDYGPEMAVKVAEVQGLRRAFNVTGLGAADEIGADDTPPANVDVSTGEISQIAGSGSFDATASQQSPSTTAAAATRTTDDESSMGYVDEFTIVAWRNQLANMGADARERVKKRWKATEYGVWGSDKYNKSYEEAISQLISTELQKVYDANRKLVNAKMKEVGVTSDDARHELIEKATKGRKNSTGKLSAAEAAAVLDEVEALRLADGAA